MAEDSGSDKPDLTQGVPFEAIPDGGMLAGKVGPEAVLLVRTAGAVRAFGGTCTHLGAPIDQGLCTAGTIRCPWHHARFDMGTGEAVAAPAFDPLPAWAVEQHDGRVFVTRKVEGKLTQKPRHFGSRSEPGIVIVGGGAAGYAAAHELREWGHEGPITMVSADESPPYDRTLLTKDYLDGKFGAGRLPIARKSLDDLVVRFISATEVETIRRAEHQVAFRDGRELAYSKLLLATGAQPRRLNVPGAHLPHVRLLRSLADCRALLARLVPGAKVVVVGSSFVGLEAAASIRSRGFDVTVVTPEHEPMREILGPELSRTILSVHTKNGVVFRLNAKVTAVTEHAIEFADGTALPADVVVIGIGVEPRVKLAKAAGLDVADGVNVDQFLRTSDPDIYAAGDIAAWPDPRSGDRIRVEHWVVAERHGQTVARNMLGENEPFTAVPFFWSKHFDFSFRYVGHAETWDDMAVEGDLEERKATVRLRRQDGRDMAVVTVENDMAALRAEIEMEQTGQP